MPDQHLIPAAQVDPPRRSRPFRPALPLALAAAIAATAAAVALATTSSNTSTPAPQPQMPPGMPMNAGHPPSGGLPPSSSGIAPGADSSPPSSSSGAPPSGSDLATELGRQLAGNGQAAIALSRVEALANQRPAGAQVDAAAKTVRFTTARVNLVMVGSPPTADMKFRAAGIDNPTIEVPAGAQITLEFINGDSDMAHMWLLQIGDSGPASVQPGWGGGAHVAAAPPLGDPTSAGQPAETISFTAPPPGTYHYDCPFPGHAAQGMYGRFVVQS